MEFYFLLFSLFFPRITMVVSFMFGAYPDNSVWLIWDWILGLFLPRILVLIYIYQNMGYETPWFWLHLIVAVVVFFSSSWRTYRWRYPTNVVVVDDKFEAVEFIEE